MKIKLFNLPNLLTATNLLCGIFAIILAFAGRLDLAPFAVFAGLFCDFFDGFLARKMGVSGELGKQLDSLADVITFGLAPGIIMMLLMASSIYMDNLVFEESFQSHVHREIITWTNTVFYGIDNEHNASMKYLPFVALFIPFMSMFRLAKFNIDNRQSDSFIGVPTPLNSMFFMFFPLVFWMDFELWKNQEYLYSFIFNPYLISGLVVVMSLLLVSEIPLISLKFKSFQWKENKIRFIFLITCLLFIVILWVWSIPLIVLLYLILSVIDSKKAKNKNYEI